MIKKKMKGVTDKPGYTSNKDHVWIEGPPDTVGLYQALCPPLLPHLKDKPTRKIVRLRKDPRSGRIVGWILRATHHCPIPWPEMPKEST